MKILSSELYHLIKSLSPSEKRYFKLNTKNAKGLSKHYILLFDAVDNLRAFNDKSIRSKISPICRTERPDSVNLHLLKSILKSLRNFHSTDHSSVEIKLHNLMVEIEILYEKALYSHSIKLLIKTKQLALEYGKDLFLLEVFKWEKKIFYSVKHTVDLKKVLSEETETLIERTNIHEYDQLLQNMLMLTKNMPKDKDDFKQIQEIINHPLMKDHFQAYSFDSKMRFFNIQVLYYQVIGDYITAKTICDQWIYLLESNPERINESPFKYITAIDNMLACCTKFQRWKSFLYYLKKLEKIPEKFPKNNTKRVNQSIFLLSSHHLLTFYNQSGNFIRASKLIHEIESFLTEYRSKIDDQQAMRLYLGMTNTCFGLSDYSGALKWVYLILCEKTEGEEHNDIICVSRILKMVIHYELDHIDILEHLVKSNYRYLAKKKTTFKSERLLLRYFQTGALTNGLMVEKTNIFQHLLKDLNEIIKDPLEKRNMEYFDFASWIEGKIENRPFAEVVQGKAFNRKNSSVTSSV